MIDMPTAFSRPDAELGFSSIWFQNTRRFSLSFQLTPRLSTTFRYSLLYNVNTTLDPDTISIGDVFDRSFALHYRFVDEGEFRPAFAVGLNDLIGTGFFEGEYIVASKVLPNRIRWSAGIGWGRFGTNNSFPNPLAFLGNDFETREFPFADTPGGEFDNINLFEGPAAFFGGIEWQPTQSLRLIAEYSSDGYIFEDGYAFEKKSPFNFGLSYSVTPSLTLNTQYLYGSELAAGFIYAINPKSPPYGSGIDHAPLPVFNRDDRSAATWSTDIATIRTQTEAALTAQDLSLFGLTVTGDTARLSVENDTYYTRAQAVGRAMRALTYSMPPAIETFAVTLVENGIPVTEVILPRDDIEDLEFEVDGAWTSYTRANIEDATSAEVLPGLFPRFDWGLEPYVAYSLFDPDAPLRLGFGLDLRGDWEPAPGFVLSGAIRKQIFGNIDDATRPSTSTLPRVRSESNIYDQADPSIPRLTGAWYFRPSDDLFGRVTVGYLETMFAGISGEVLWAPNDSRLAFGVELNQVVQRDFDQLFGFRDYDVTTGHASAYWDLASGYGFQLDAGRYLAGDWGATFTLDRTFDNGWRVAAFATMTDVPFEEFGEGSFDKGIILEIPVSFASGQADQRVSPVTIRPVWRDGGARLYVDGRLYDVVRDAQGPALGDAWGGSGDEGSCAADAGAGSGVHDSAAGHPIDHHARVDRGLNRTADIRRTNNNRSAGNHVADRSER